MTPEDFIRPHLPEQAKRTAIGHSVEAYAAVLLRYRGFHVHLNPCRLRSGREGEAVKRRLESTALILAVGSTIGIVACVIWEAACR